jgi:hypothetical protein
MGLPRPPAAPSPCRWRIGPLACPQLRLPVRALVGRNVRAHYLAPDGRLRPAKTPGRTAVSPRLLIRMRPEVQVLPGPPLAMTSPNAGRRVQSPLGWADNGPRTLTWLPALVMRPAVVGSVRALHPPGSTQRCLQGRTEQRDLASAGRELDEVHWWVILASRPIVCSRPAGDTSDGTPRAACWRSNRWTVASRTPMLTALLTPSIPATNSSPAWGCCSWSGRCGGSRVSCSAAR